VVDGLRLVFSLHSDHFHPLEDLFHTHRGPRGERRLFFSFGELPGLPEFHPLYGLGQQDLNPLPVLNEETQSVGHQLS
jgi:hypothetical protein